MLPSTKTLNEDITKTTTTTLITTAVITKAITKLKIAATTTTTMLTTTTKLNLILFSFETIKHKFSNNKVKVYKCEALVLTFDFSNEDL